MAVGSAHRNSTDSMLEQLLSTLEQICQKVDSSEDDQAFLRQLLQDRSLRALLFVHNVVSTRNMAPASHNAWGLAQEAIQSLKKKEATLQDARELRELLFSGHLQTLLETHDMISRREYIPILPEMPYDMEEEDEEEETIKIVQLVKSNEPLGATIRFNEPTGTIVIARIMHGGAADRSGLIHVGDEVHEVNGVSVKGKAPFEVVRILQQSLDGAITFKLVPVEDGLPARESRVRVRAHFSYDPCTDDEIPCKEAGLTFRKGDVLHLVEQEDPDWWQARKEGERNCRAGLIPGRRLIERRLAAAARKTVVEEETTSLCGSPKHLKGRKIKKIMYDIKENDDFDREEIATYEEVAKLYPRPGLHRPIVLIGPPGVGRNELKSRLIAIDPEIYQTPVPHTSRPKKPWEVEGQEYFFVPRALMEEEVRMGQFVEYGEYRGHLYGTSVETVRLIVNAGYICVMTPHPQALKKLRTPEMKAFVVFVKPPKFEDLVATRKESNAKSTFDETSSRGFSEEEFHDIIYFSQKMENLYSHMFDLIIVNDNLPRAFHELCLAIRKLSLDPQWVPASWVATC